MTDDLTALTAEFAAAVGTKHRCQVCTNERRALVDHLMRGGAGSASIEKFFNMKDWPLPGRTTLDHHKRLRHHLVEPVSEVA